MTTQERLVRTKCVLLSEGVHVSEPVADAIIEDGLKMPERVRSGSSEGLELRIEGMSVLAAVRRETSSATRFHIARGQDGFRLTDGVESWPVHMSRAPQYYNCRTSSGVPMAKLAHTCFDRVGVVALRECHFWANPGSRCAFCAYGSNLDSETSDRHKGDLAEAVRHARDDVAQPSRHVLITGGTDADVDGVVVSRIAAVAAELRLLGMPLDAMLSPPTDRESLERLRASGVGSVAINVEVFDRQVAERLIPGKWRLGLDRYMRALSDAVAVFGPGNVRSLLVVGLESHASTLEGVRAIAQTGALPTLSPFRPVRGSDLAYLPAPDADALEAIYHASREVLEGTGARLGPSCVDCQCNTLTFPWDSGSVTPVAESGGRRT